jgi:hypothetical protein
MNLWKSLQMQRDLMDAAVLNHCFMASRKADRERLDENTEQLIELSLYDRYIDLTRSEKS